MLSMLRILIDLNMFLVPVIYPALGFVETVPVIFLFYYSPYFSILVYVTFCLCSSSPCMFENSVSGSRTD